MRIPIVPIGAVVLIAPAVLAAGFHPDSDAAPKRDAEHAPIVFVCRNGVAMSVWSALTFNRLAAEHGLAIRAVSRAAAPTFSEVPLRMKLALALEGYLLHGYQPRVISAADVRAAERVILIDTELPASASSPRASIENWDGFPPMREKYFASRAALKTEVEELVAQLAAARSVE